jgi:hypothetical protein
MYDNFDHEALKLEIFNSIDKSIIFIKGELIQINNHTFFVRNCHPASGILDSNTKISIENKEISNITSIKVAVIKVKQ